MNIKLTPEQAEAFGRGESITLTPKPKQWEPRMGAFYPSGCRYPRRTEDDSDKCYSIMRTHNRLLAYVDEFGGDWEANWENSEQLKYSVYYGYISKLWGRDFSQTLCTNGTVYMSKDCAEGLAAKLNSGEVVL